MMSCTLLRFAVFFSADMKASRGVERSLLLVFLVVSFMPSRHSLFTSRFWAFCIWLEKAEKYDIHVTSNMGPTCLKDVAGTNRVPSLPALRRWLRNRFLSSCSDRSEISSDCCT